MTIVATAPAEALLSYEAYMAEPAGLYPCEWRW